MIPILRTKDQSIHLRSIVDPPHPTETTPESPNKGEGTTVPVVAHFKPFCGTEYRTISDYIGLYRIISDYIILYP